MLRSTLHHVGDQIYDKYWDSTLINIIFYVALVLNCYFLFICCYRLWSFRCIRNKVDPDLELGVVAVKETWSPVGTGDQPVMSSYTAGKCAICLENYRKGEVLWVLSRCKHDFHTLCIKEWLRQNNKCPICRANAFRNICSVFC
ncbi:hypothetical protein SLEP1_g46256 [Rubroshorea leprosula]|uniref:RING-type E3 ubiquitin transferase n=1 Tax=Rubroshorea leprosula TaxID=152421 RepID=A0AAV5LN70_9ROSI|nr:hypothetical protein SLEP1_g46256 [Rubroshorea leprosula]